MFSRSAGSRSRASWRPTASFSAPAPPGTGRATSRRSVTPVGHAGNPLLDLSSSNFGIEEVVRFSPAARKVCPGTPEIRDGCLWANDHPGPGIDIDIDEALGASLVLVRQTDGTVIRW